MNTELSVFNFDDGRQNFEKLGRPNGATHWLESDLRDALGYQTEASFSKAITRAKQACLSLGIQCEDHFVRQSDASHLLTRFGCYLVAMNGDPKKPEVAAAQVYFAALAETFQSAIEHASGIDRMLIRDEVTDGQKSLMSTAKSHGVVNYAYFQNKGYLGMYNMNLDRLCKTKGIGPNEVLIDRMGKTELAAHLFRITQTDDKIKNDSVRGQAALEKTAFDVGQEIRATLKRLSRTAPEHLPISENIKSVRKQLKTTSKALGKLDKPKKKTIGGDGG